MQAGIAIGVFAVTFLLGSVPWGLVVSKAFYGKDLRDEGSGNIGTTNAIRSMGKVGGYAVFLLDFGKGLLSGALALAVAGWSAGQVLPPGNPAQPWADLLAAVSFLGCVWGHVFSPWLKFRGGKGIAVAIGCLFIVFGPVGAVVELVIFAAVVIATRYVSAGSIAATVACPFLALWLYWGEWLAWLLIAAGALTVIWAHRGNIARLRAGNERRIGDAGK